MARRSLIQLGLFLAFLAGATLLLTALGLLLDFPLTSLLFRVLLYGALVAVALWGLWRGLQAFLWRVGRRLAFSYFLIGVLPIPMGLLLILLNAYLLAGYFLGHLYRDAVAGLSDEISEIASDALGEYEAGRGPASIGAGDISLAYYRQGRKVRGPAWMPEDWPSWLEALDGEVPRREERRETVRPFVARPDGAPSLAALAGGSDSGVVAAFDEDLERELTRRSEVWVLLLRADDPRRESMVRVQLGQRAFDLQPVNVKRTSEGRSELFGEPDGEQPWWRRPIIWWGEAGGPLLSLASGEPVADNVGASLNGNPATVYRHLFSTSAEIDTAVWGGLIAITGLLSSIYALAILMALVMIFSLSRAVNRLSRATETVRAGDFTVRIPVRRRDQVGELQSSFNEMTANLERSVSAVTQKEILEKELKIARDLQQSLLPADLPSSESVEFSTLFEPSAAIGGDYFDVLRLDEERLMVVIADVSGHGLPTGLRMAMLKAALVILVEEGKPPEEVFQRLSSMIRSADERRVFVTATLAVIDFGRGEMELTNAGHPPTYLLRDGEVREILLPGSPLGTLGQTYGRHRALLEKGDVVVWLSDGLIEVADPDGEPFGYERVRAALLGPASGAAQVRDRLLAAEEAHTRGTPARDDKTLVAMRYLGPSAAGSPRNE